MASDDKRRGSRRGLFYYLKATRAPGGEAVGHVVNLTEGGIMLMAVQPVEPGAKMTLHVELPPPFEAYSPLVCPVLCRWSGPSVTPGHLDIGFEFVEKDLARSDLVRRILKEIGFTGS